MSNTKAQAMIKPTLHTTVMITTTANPKATTKTNNIVITQAMS